MSLTRKERTRRALQHESVDQLPTQVNYTTAMGKLMAAHLGTSIAELPRCLGNHLVRVDLTYPRKISMDGNIVYDWWGSGWSTKTEGYWLSDAPLAHSKDLDAFPWPDPNDPHLLDEAAKVLTDDNCEHFIVPNFGFCLYERAWSLRGYETLNMDLALDQEFVVALLERITEIQVILARRFVALGVDGGYFGDDYGAQKGLLFSPHIWRKLFKPRLQRMFSVFQEAGLPVIFHSDGNISELVPDLVEIGVTALNPVQPEVIDHIWLKQTFGQRLAFYGGVSTQTVLPFGTPIQVQEAVKQSMATLANDGTGLLVAPSHRLTSEIPMENVDAMLSAFAKLGSST